MGFFIFISYLFFPQKGNRKGTEVLQNGLGIYLLKCHNSEDARQHKKIILSFYCQFF